MFWKNWSLSRWVLSVAVVLFLAFPFRWMVDVLSHLHEKEHAPRVSCQSNLKQIGLAFAQYVEDYDGRFPLIASTGPTSNNSSYGWGDRLQPYLKSTQLYQCPSQGDSGQTDPTKTDYTDYFFNARLARKPIAKLANPAKSVLMGEGNDGLDVTNARYSKLVVSSDWVSDENSPLYRHYSTANYLFVDGHVKSFPPKTIQEQLEKKALIY